MYDAQVFHTLAAMGATGVDLFIDVHGDETLPFTFISGAEGVAAWGPRLRSLHGAFVGALSRANTDVQAQFGYEADEPLKGNLAMATNAVTQRFNCLGMTLEMPFKDSALNPDDVTTGSGFNGVRAAQVGRALVDAAAHVAPQLRGVEAPTFPLASDAYVVPVEDPDKIAAWLSANPHGPH